MAYGKAERESTSGFGGIEELVKTHQKEMNKMRDELQK